jgi:phospholipid/cholesterol/gamma-HCH transport system substrate-binding protein
MNLSRRIRIQLCVFIVVTLIAGGVMIVRYMQLPAALFGVGHYTVTMELPSSGGLYGTANVSYRGKEIGKVSSVSLTDSGVAAELSIESDYKVPSNVRAQVHSRSAVGEQYVELIPEEGDSKPLGDGSVIPLSRTSVPPDIGTLMDSVNGTLSSLPQENLGTVIDESYNAFNGTGPELRRIIESITALSGQARENLDPSVALIKEAGPVLGSQGQTADAIGTWANRLNDISGQLSSNDDHVRSILRNGPATADQANALFQQIRPTLPILLTNLVSLGEMAVVYNAAIEQILVLLPQGTAIHAATLVPNLGTDLPGAFLSFNLNLNLPQPCTTGYLPASERRNPVEVDYPDRPEGNFYCRIPQSENNVIRGVRNFPCLEEPGKRAPTVQECASSAPYVPLNNGRAAVGDPNATDTGQTVPQNFRDADPDNATRAGPAVATAEYDPETGTYVGPDGKVYRQTDLAHQVVKEMSWQTMMTPAGR